MADSTASASSEAAKSAPKPQNPALKMMGLPNFRFKLPSRNWMIFLTVTGSFTAALIYDRREKRRAQQKWCNLVAHISKESLPVEETRRKLTVFLAAPPGDGIRSAREHFKEYVKPILVAAALDYNVIEGRREGDIRAKFAEEIRKQRLKSGEVSAGIIGDEEKSTEDVIAEARKAIGVRAEPGPRGDLVIGRHTWKEYVRGLHEGWLGPIDPPVSAESQPALEEPQVPAAEVPANTEEQATPAPEQGHAAEKKEEGEEEKKPSKPTGPTPAYVAPSDYSGRTLPRSIPQTLDGSAAIPFPHLLGFLNTPIRIYRFLNRRYVADSVGRDVAALVLASHARPYAEGPASSSSDSDSPVDPSLSSSITYEQQSQLENEEHDWHKSVHKTDDSNPDKEREWLNDVVMDPRIAARMQRYVLSEEEEARAQRIAQGLEYIRGEERPPAVPFWQRVWIKYGYGEDPEVAKRKPIIGNLDEENA
ncbi:mitochondrial import inner membrane translocase subunit Tim54 [Aspergillus tetrazonus]